MHLSVRNRLIRRQGRSWRRGGLNHAIRALENEEGRTEKDEEDEDEEKWRRMDRPTAYARRPHSQGRERIYSCFREGRAAGLTGLRKYDDARTLSEYNNGLKGMHVLLSNAQAEPGKNFSQPRTSLLVLCRPCRPKYTAGTSHLYSKPDLQYRDIRIGHL